MRATWIGAWALVLGLLLVPSAVGGALDDLDYAPYDVRLVDTRGVQTEATEFGFFSGPNMFTVRRGDTYVDVLFRKIQSVEIGEYVPSKGYYPASVTSRAGKTFDVEIERIEGQRFLGGVTDVGNFRIRLGQIRRLEVIRFTPPPEGIE